MFNKLTTRFFLLLYRHRSEETSHSNIPLEFAVITAEQFMYLYKCPTHRPSVRCHPFPSELSLIFREQPSRNMKLMSVTLDVSTLSGWLKAEAE